MLDKFTQISEEHIKQTEKLSKKLEVTNDKIERFKIDNQSSLLKIEELVAITSMNKDKVDSFEEDIIHARRASTFHDRICCLENDLGILKLSSDSGVKDLRDKLETMITKNDAIQMSNNMMLDMSRSVFDL